MHEGMEVDMHFIYFRKNFTKIMFDYIHFVDSWITVRIHIFIVYSLIKTVFNMIFKPRCIENKRILFDGDSNEGPVPPDSSLPENKRTLFSLDYESAHTHPAGSSTP